jgi:hypothetical protein
VRRAPARRVEKNDVRAEPVLGAPSRQKLWPILGCFIAFSLILTFSRWEKEQPLAGFVKSASSQAESCFRFAKTLGTFLPLPAGEGRGEGEHPANPNSYTIKK